MTLSHMAILIGFLFAVAGGWACANPSGTRHALTLFPRHRTAAIILTLFNAIWVAWMVYHAPLGRFDEWKPALFILAPVTFFAVITYMDELLAPRMLGGAILLLVTPLLHTARWNESDLRLIVVTLAYLFIVWAVVLVLSPFRFRYTFTRLMVDDGRAQVSGVVGLIVGLGIAGLGFFAF